MSEILDRVRAVVALENSKGNLSTRRSRAFAFVSLMHPERSLEDRLEIANDIAQGGSDE